MGDSNFVYEVSNRWGYVTVVLDNNAKKVFPFTNTVHLQVVFEERQGEQNGKEERAVQTVSDCRGDVQNFSTCFDSNLMVTFDQPVVKEEIDEVEALFSYGALGPSDLIPVDTAITGDSHVKKGELSLLFSSCYGQDKSKNGAKGLNAANLKELSSIPDKSSCVVETEEAENARQNHDTLMCNRQRNYMSDTGSSGLNSENDLASGKDAISCPRRSTRRCQKSPYYGNSDTVFKSIPELVGNESAHAVLKMGKDCSKRKLDLGKNYKLHIQPSGLSTDGSKPGFFCCQLCNRLFKYKLSFQKHKAWHKQQKRKRKPKHCFREISGDVPENTKSRIFRCEICYRFFKYKLSFQKHMTQHRKVKNLKEVKKAQNDVGEFSDDVSKKDNTEESGVFICEVCDQLFKYKLSYEKHMSQHKEEDEKAHGKIQNCADILETGDNEQSLKGCNLRPRNLNYSFIDFEEEDGEDEEIPAKKVKKSSKKAITCGECNEVFRTKFKYKRHQRQVHGLDYDYPCIICGDTFKTLLLLKTHRKTQHNNRRCEYFCRVCGFVCGTRRDIKKHERTHGILCNLCNETFHLSGHMTRHLREKHMDDVDENGVKLVKSCSLCIRVFLSEKRLQKHMSSHEGTKPNICFKCGCMFNTRSSLNTHIANHHNPTAPSHICCEICGARLSNKKTLSGHMIQVHGKKTYKCSYCPKAFVNANKLSIHVRTHTREKPFTCEVCGKGFGQHYNLTIHMRTHTQVKPFPCGLCGLNFAYKCSLQSHQRTKHHAVYDLPRNETAKAEVVQIEEFEL